MANIHLESGEVNFAEGDSSGFMEKCPQDTSTNVQNYKDKFSSNFHIIPTTKKLLVPLLRPTSPTEDFHCDPSEEEVAPVHLQPQKNRHQSEDDAQVRVKFKANKVEEAHKKSVERRNFSLSEESAYPGIPFQVAQCLYNFNPEIVDHVESTLLEEKYRVSSFNPNTSLSANSNSSFKHFAASDGFSLQESVIGKHKEVSLQIMNGCENPGNQPDLEKVKPDKSPVAICPSPVAVVDDSPPKNATTDEPNVSANTDVDNYNEMSTPIKELHRIPADRITMTIERKPSWFSPIAAEASPDPAYPSPQPSTQQQSPTLSLNLDKLEMFSDKDSVSGFSDRFEIESNMSDKYEVQSNASEVSGIEDELFRVRQLLLSSPTSDGSSVGIESSARANSVVMERSKLFELQRHDAHLQGQVEALQQEVQALRDERAVLQSQTGSLQAQLNSQTAIARSAAAEQAQLRKRADELDRKSSDAADAVAHLQAALESRTVEVSRMREDIREADLALAQVRVTLEETKVDLASRDGAVRGLKTKVAELHVALEMANQDRQRAVLEAGSAKTDADALRKAKEWYSEQLQLANASRSKAQQEAISLQASLATQMATTEKLRMENTRLRAHINEAQQRTVKEKEALARKLEAIEADMMEREAAVEQLQRDSGHSEHSLAVKIKAVEDERAKMSQTLLKVADLEHRTIVAEEEARARGALVVALEKELAEAAQMVVMAREAAAEREMAAHHVEERKRCLEAKVKELEADATVKGAMLAALQQEKAETMAELMTAKQEKREVDDALAEIQANVQQLEVRFRKVKEEFTTKSAISERLEAEKSRLEQELNMREQQLMALSRNIEAQRSQDSQSSVETTDSNQVQSVILQSERKPEVDTSSQDTDDYVESLLREKQFLETKVSLLVEENQQLSHVTGISKAECAVQTEEDKMLRRRETAVKILTRKMKELLKSNKALSCEIKTLKDKEKEMELAANDSERISRERTKDAKLLYFRKKVVQVERKMGEMQQLYETERKRADKNQELALELERQKGRLHSVAESNVALRQQAHQLEAALVARELVVSELDLQTRGLSAKQEHDEGRIRQRITDLEERLTAELEVQKELRRQIFNEKKEASGLKKQLHSVHNAMDRANELAEARGVELSRVAEEVNKLKQIETKLRREVEGLARELSNAKLDSDRYKSEVEECRAKDPLLGEQIKTLSWHLKQKSQEAAALKERQVLIEERQNAELESVQNMLKSTQYELENVKVELQNMMKEKFAYQSKVTELRSALKSSVEHSKSLKDHIFSDPSRGGNSSQFMSFQVPASPTPYDESFISGLLQQSACLPQSKPLCNLQACLNTLKQEMVILQKQLQEHSDGSFPQSKQ